MWKRCWRRLAGWLAIELSLAAAVCAAGFEYQAGTAAFGQARALALEDRRGGRVVVVQAENGVTHAVSDFVSARLLREYGIGREGVVLLGKASGQAAAEDLFTAAAAALGSLDAGDVRFDGGVLSVSAADGRCRASLASLGGLRFDDCRGGEVVRSPIRAAFRSFEPVHGLERRGDRPLSCPVQAIAFGKNAAVLALGGEVPPARFAAPGLIVVGYANDTAPPPHSASFDAAVRAILKRVR